MVDLTGGVLLEVTGSSETSYYPNLEGGTAAEASCWGPPPLLALDAANLRSLRNQFAAVRRS
jgi:hypothetical protein